MTSFVACGISGCSGGGFGPAFAPGQAQIGLLLAGAAVLPLSQLLLDGRSTRVRKIGGLAAAAAGSVLAMVLTGLGPHGCPLGQSRSTAGPDGFSPGAATCSADRDAVR